jgi:hypothetical protein
MGLVEVERTGSDPEKSGWKMIGGTNCATLMVPPLRHRKEPP